MQLACTADVHVIGWKKPPSLEVLQPATSARIGAPPASIRLIPATPSWPRRVPAYFLAFFAFLAAFFGGAFAQTPSIAPAGSRKTPMVPIAPISMNGSTGFAPSFV